MALLFVFRASQREVQCLLLKCCVTTVSGGAHISRWKIKAGLADGDVTPSVRFPAAPVKLQRPWLCQRGTTTMPIMGTSNVSEIYICEQIVCLAPISCAVWWTEQKKGSVLTWTASSMKTWRSVWGNWQTGGKRHEHRALRGRRWH